jgi:hypothetical protein
MNRTNYLKIPFSFYHVFLRSKKEKADSPMETPISKVINKQMVPDTAQKKTLPKLFKKSA